MKLRALLAAATVAGLLARGPSARADEDFDPNRVFKAGLEQFDAGNVRAAIDTWEQLIRTMGEQRAWKALYNLGLAYQRQGDVTRAIERLEAFAVFVQQQPEIGTELADRRDDAAERVRTMKAANGAVRVLAASGTDVELVRVNTSEPRPAGFTVYLGPGQHTFEIHVGTSRARKIVLDLHAGERRDLTTSERMASPPPPPPVRHEQEGGRHVQMGWLLGGAGVTVLSALVPVFLGLDTENRRQHALGIARDDPKYPGAVEDYESGRTRYYVSFALPAVLGITTAVVVLLTMSSDRNAASR